MNIYGVEMFKKGSNNGIVSYSSGGMSLELTNDNCKLIEEIQKVKIYTFLKITLMELSLTILQNKLTGGIPTKNSNVVFLIKILTKNYTFGRHYLSNYME